MVFGLIKSGFISDLSVMFGSTGKIQAPVRDLLFCFCCCDQVCVKINSVFSSYDLYFTGFNGSAHVLIRLCLHLGISMTN